MGRLPALGRRALVALRQDPRKNRLRQRRRDFAPMGDAGGSVGWSVWAGGVGLALGKLLECGWSAVGVRLGAVEVPAKLSSFVVPLTNNIFSVCDSSAL